MAEENKTTIALTSDDIKSLADAATAMNNAASSIAASMDAVKQSVDSLGQIITDAADEMDEAQTEAEYDRKLREEAERMQAAATGRVDDDTHATIDADAIVETMSGMQTVLGDILNSLSQNGDDDKSPMQSIIGDTVTASVSKVGDGILGKLDDAVGVFSSISEQLGSVKSWIDSAKQMQMSANPSSAIEQPDEAPTEEPSVEQPSNELSSIIEQYSGLTNTLGEVGTLLRQFTVELGDRQSARDAEVSNDSVGPESEPISLDDLGNLFNNTLLGIGDTLREGVHLDDSLFGKLDGITGTIGSVVSSLNSLSTTLMPHADSEHGSPVVAESLRMVERVTENIIRDRETTKMDDSADPQVDGNDGLPNEIARLADMIGAFSASNKVSMNNGNDFKISVPQVNQIIGTVATAMPLLQDSGIRDIVGDVAVVDRANLDDNTATADTYTSSDNSDRSVTVTNQTYNNESTTQTTDNRSLISALPDDLVSTLQSVMTPVASTVPNSEINETKGISSETDRYGATGNPYTEAVVNSAAPTADAVPSSAKPDAQPPMQIVQQAQPSVVKFDSEQAEIMAGATMQGVLNALLNEQFKSMIESSISDTVRYTVKALIG